MPKTDYTREELIAICERAVVPVDRWDNRDTPSSQEGVGHCWALLRAGCAFRVLAGTERCSTDERTIWLAVMHPTFNTFELGEDDAGLDAATFYLPTPASLDAANGGDWY
jgi:hypothetical protein